MDKQTKAQASILLGNLTRKSVRFIPLFALLCYLSGGAWVILSIELFDSDGLMMLMQFPILASIVLLFFWFSRYRPIKKNIKRILQTDGIHDLERLVSETERYANRKIPLMGEKYFFYPKRGLLIKYNEIAWLYNRQVNTQLHGVTVRADTSLMLCTIFGQVKAVKLTKEDAAVIAAKNPSLMVGYTEQNINTYQIIVEQYKEK